MLDYLRAAYYAAVDDAKRKHLAYCNAKVSWLRWQLKDAWELAEYVRESRHREYMTAIDSAMR